MSYLSVETKLRVTDCLDLRDALRKAVTKADAEFAALFIDDHRPNVEAALARGWQAVHFTNPQALAADLARLGLLGT